VRALNGIVGIAALGLLGFFAHLVLKVLHGPGDDNPVVSLFFLAMLLSLVPAWGLVRAIRGNRPERDTRAGKVRGWIGWSASFVLVVLLGVVAVMFR
jgi:hypothetical protein